MSIIPKRRTYRRYEPRKAVNPKVKAAAGGASAGVVVSAFVLWVLAALFWGGNVDAIPVQVDGMVFLIVPGATAFASGWLKNELPRP